MIELYRHIKSGRVYRFITHARVEADKGRVVTVYQSLDDDQAWVRPATEFYEKFRRLPHIKSAGVRERFEMGTRIWEATLIDGGPIGMGLNPCQALEQLALYAPR